jgi:hypothetical protein
MKLLERQLIQGALQSAVGSPAVPTATDVVAVYGVTPPKMLSESLERGMAQNTLGNKAKFIVTKGQELEVKSELKGSGIAGTPPEIGQFLRMCRMTEIVEAGTSVTYLPNSSEEHEVGTIYFFQSGILHQLVDACGSFKIDLSAGKFGEITFKFTGSYIAPVDMPIPDLSPLAVVPPRFAEAQFTFDSQSLVIQTLSIDMGNSITERPDANAVNGLRGFGITDRAPTCSFDPEAVNVADYDVFGVWASSAQKAMSTTLGTTAGNIVGISAPKVQIITPDYGNREKILTHALSCELIKDVGDDELQLVFT